VVIQAAIGNTAELAVSPAGIPASGSFGYWLTELMNLSSSPSGVPTYHLPVLVREVVHHLVEAPVNISGGVYVDGTAGEGGHSQALLEASPAPRLVLGIDLDPRSLESVGARLAVFGDRNVAVQGNYADMDVLAQAQGVDQVDGVLLDLGFSSRQIERDGYGLSFQTDEPLDMRYDPNATLTAEFIVNDFQEHELADLIYRFGEEHRSRAIARVIVRNRPIYSTTALANLVASTIGRRPGTAINPATRTFQALRIAVNDELANVERGLEAAVQLLKPGGRLAVISYHSLEDRIVKSYLVREAAECICPPGMPVCTCEHTPRLGLINRRVIKPSTEEVRSNPRSRSAKLRVAERL
jgi:16S rRNA (cytosine1402-N4)-methyltransferase